MSLPWLLSISLGLKLLLKLLLGKYLLFKLLLLIILDFIILYILYLLTMSYKLVFLLLKKFLLLLQGFFIDNLVVHAFVAFHLDDFLLSDLLFVCLLLISHQHLLLLKQFL